MTVTKVFEKSKDGYNAVQVGKEHEFAGREALRRSGLAGIILHEIAFGILGQRDQIRAWPRGSVEYVERLRFTSRQDLVEKLA